MNGTYSRGQAKPRSDHKVHFGKRSMYHSAFGLVLLVCPEYETVIPILTPYPSFPMGFEDDPEWRYASLPYRAYPRGVGFSEILVL